jgi:hypothetical protein
MQVLRRRVVLVGIFFVALTAILVGNVAHSPLAFAQGEYFQYITADDTIRVTGGMLSVPAGLHRTGATSFEGGITVSGAFARVPNGNDPATDPAFKNPCNYTLIVSSVEGDLKIKGNQPPDGGHKAIDDFPVETPLRLPGPGECRLGDNLLTGDLLQHSLDGNIIIHPGADPRGDAGGAACPGSNAPAGTNCASIPAGCPGSSQTLPAGQTAPDNCHFDAVSTTEQAEEPDLCPIEKATALRWIACPIVSAGEAITNALDAIITQYLTIDTSQIFGAPSGNSGQPGDPNSNQTSSGFYQAWSTFRNFGIGILVIVGLLMVLSEALGLEIVDALTIRRTLPRLLVAGVFVAVSWNLAYYVTTFFNRAGIATADIINSSFGAQVSSQQLQGGQIFAQYFGLGAGLLALGVLGILSFLGTLILALMVGVAILIVRIGIIDFGAVILPLGFAFYPFYQGFTNFVWGTFWKANAAFIGIAGTIAIFKVLAIIINQSNNTGASVVSIGCIFAGYFILPLVAKATFGFLGTIAGAVNDRSRGGFDRLKKFRQGQASTRFNDARAGKGNFVGANAAGAVYRRATYAGGLNPTARGRGKFRAAHKLHTKAHIEDAIKHDNNLAAGNDDANALAQQDGITRASFLRQYAQKQIDKSRADFNAGKADSVISERDAMKQAHDALGEIEYGYGAQIGSTISKATAYRARAASNKGYDVGGMEQPDYAERIYQAAFTDAAMQVNSGAMSLSDAAAVIKSNKAQPALSGIGFGAAMAQIDKTAKAMKGGERRPEALVTSADAKALANDVLKGSSPGEIMQGRHESINALAPYMIDNVKEKVMIARSTGNYQEMDTQLANLANIYDELGRSSPLKQQAMAKVMSETVVDPTTRQDFTIRKLLEEARNRPPDSQGRQYFRENRREYGSREEEEQGRSQGDYDKAG